MKRNLILSFLACGMSVVMTTAARAQTAADSPSASPSASPGEWHHHWHDGGGGGGMLAHLTEALGLTGTQEAQVAQILQAAKPQAEANRAQAQANRKALIDSVSAQITPLLTADQQAKFTAMVQKMESGPGAGGAGGFRHFEHGGKFGGEQGGPGGGGAMVLQRLTTELGLTAEQQSEIKPILDAAHTQVLAVRNDTSLTPKEKFAKIKDTMEGARSQINGILTPAQQAQLASMKEKWHHKGGDEGSPSPAPTTTGS